MGAGGIKCPILLPICVFPLGSKPLRKDDTHIYCSFCLLLSSRIQTPARVCAVRGAVALFGRVSAFTGVLWLLSGLPVQFLNSPEGFHLGVRVEKCLNSTGEIRGGGGENSHLCKFEIAQAFQRDV